MYILFVKFRGYRKIKFNIPIIVSSGATNGYLLRTPLDYLALTTLFDLPPPLRLSALADNPMRVVQRNREKLSQDYVSPNIRIIQRESA